MHVCVNMIKGLCKDFMSVCKSVCISRQAINACGMKWVCAESHNAHAHICVYKCPHDLLL